MGQENNIRYYEIILCLIIIGNTVLEIRSGHFLSIPAM